MFLKQIKEKCVSGKNKIKQIQEKWTFRKKEKLSSTEDFLSTNLRQKTPVQSFQQTTRILPSKPFRAYQKTQPLSGNSQNTTVRLSPVSAPPPKNISWIKFLPFVFLVLGIFGAILFSKFPSEFKEEQSEEQEVLWQVHEVKTGETLWSLACFYYGSPQFWKEIFLANAEELKRSKTLEPGTTLIIPSLSSPLKQ